MSREIIVVPDQEANIVGTLEKILKELKKMNMYLALMNDVEIQNEDVED